jgi:hypothetical protein
MVINMKKKRSIIIKSPPLKEIRNVLRRILILESNKRSGEVIDERIAIEQDSSGNLRDLSPKDDRKLIDLCARSGHLSDKLTDSICVCGSCHAVDKDMTYNPTIKKWYCVDCFNEFRDTYIHEKPLMVEEDDWDGSMEYFFRSFTEL